VQLPDVFVGQAGAEEAEEGEEEKEKKTRRRFRSRLMTVHEQRVVTAWPHDRAGAEGISSLELRWILPGRLPDAAARWFGRFPAAVESRQDAYLPPLGGLSVKRRGDGPFEVKIYRGSAGFIDVAGRARGRMEYWQKWSFRFDPPVQHSDEPAGWSKVHKTRHVSWFSLSGESCRTGPPGLSEEPGCAVELTKIRVRGEAWWTLGFEATGPAEMLCRELEAAATLVFAQPPPAGLNFGIDDCRSYAEWLCQRPSADASHW
jgi:hypothetical protein